MPADVLADGRILFESGFPLGEGSTPEMFLVYSDGSAWSRTDAIIRRILPGTVGRKAAGSGDVVFTHGDRWRGSLRHWRMKSELRRRAESMRVQLRRRLRARGL